jgi:hypothetical protein
MQPYQQARNDLDISPSVECEPDINALFEMAGVMCQDAAGPSASLQCPVSKNTEILFIKAQFEVRTIRTGQR